MLGRGINLTRDSAETYYCFPYLKGSCPRSQTLILIKLTMYLSIVLIILMAVCGNLLIIISISHFKQLHSPTNLLILSLACNDCFFGASIMPYSMIRDVESCWYFGEICCQIHSSIDIMMTIESLLLLGLISVDRYLAICKPLQYRTSVTMHKVAAVIGITWIFSFAFGFGVIFFKINLVGEEELSMNSCTGTCILHFNEQGGRTAAFLGLLVLCIVMMALYMKIFYVAKVQARKIDCSQAMSGVKQEKKNRTSEQRERKAAKTLAIVLGVFMLCWLPYTFFLIVDPFFSTPAVVLKALVWFAYFNSACNPLIYGFFYPWFRRVFTIIISGRVFQNGSSLINIFAESN